MQNEISIIVRRFTSSTSLIDTALPRTSILSLKLSLLFTLFNTMTAQKEDSKQPCEKREAHWLVVTEYSTHEKICPGCGKVHKSVFPVNISQPTQYGANMKAFMAYLVDYQMLPLKRAVETIEAMTGQNIFRLNLMGCRKVSLNL